MNKNVLIGLFATVLVATSVYLIDRENKISINKNNFRNKSIKNDQKYNLSNSHKNIIIDTSSYGNKNKEKPEHKKDQIIVTIKDENADCDQPILITDTIIYSQNSPKGNGLKLEFYDNASFDSMYFEKEHNTVWYKFISPINGQLTFDIIPISKNNDYDFMLFKFKKGDFCKNITSKILKPIRTCISRNNTKAGSKTGLKRNISLPLFVHSGEGPSYVRHLDVLKGDTYYLFLDNVYENGSGHQIILHYYPIKPGELYIGKRFTLNNLTFKDSDFEFRPTSEYKKALDSLFLFLKDNPTIKIEIQGHTNTGSGNIAHLGTHALDEFQLSLKRAEKVRDWLLTKGIESGRLICKGYGGTRLKIPNPKLKKEFYMNMRIEILLLSLDYTNDL